MKDLITQLRKRLGLSQSEFGRLIGRSLPSVQGYESGKKIPPEVVVKMIVIASQRGAEEIGSALEAELRAVAPLYVERIIEAIGQRTLADLNRIDLGALSTRMGETIREWYLKRADAVDQAMADRMRDLFASPLWKEALAKGLDHLWDETPVGCGGGETRDQARRHAHDLLDKIFAAGSPSDIEWITGNLRNFVEAIESRQEAQKRRKAG